MVINGSVRITVHRVDQASTVGWAVLLVTVQGSDNGAQVDVKMDVEWHDMRNFKLGLLLGLDTMIDYDIDLYLSSLEDPAHRYKFTLHTPY
jgi:hypothetical protein